MYGVQFQIQYVLQNACENAMQSLFITAKRVPNPLNKWHYVDAVMETYNQ